MKAVETTETDDNKVMKGNGIVITINKKANKTTINYNHATPEMQKIVYERMNKELFDLMKDLLFVEM